MWETFIVIVGFGAVADLIRRRIRELWHKRRVPQTVAALRRGETVRIRCDARFRNAGGQRHRARLVVHAEGAFLSTVDGTVSNVQLAPPGANVEVVTERSMLLCNVAGRQLEVLLPTGDDRLLKAVASALTR
ncbi:MULTISPECIES: hypothetical protein [unclassified Streptomyces]|uniref:FHA domain-containing protein n=1 Tax=Streptomyces sp. NBC_00119 TaxID=2975659 RepID=A0AAU1TYZ3_9ACTN|nr:MULTISPECIES: hypothetical protein [unclassified Streptomyces]MCX4648594.1 hypothetical protein [Streptomyces sp. NBC_01446]MCX5323287.1 hypothetical protein [Streptomyces sp. NBC_00120]